MLFEIVWDPGGLGGAAHAVVDVLRLINRLAALKAPTAAAPVHWRWVQSDGKPVGNPALAKLAPHERTGSPQGRVPKAYRSPADVIVVPGWMVRDGSEIDQWIKRSSALMPRLHQTLAQGGSLLGVFTGVVLLAAAGCLHERRFAAPWPFFVAVMRHATASGLSPSGSIDWSEVPDWTSDRGVWTCASPVATTEAVLDLMGNTAWADLASGRAPHGSVERARQWLVKHLAAPYDMGALASAAATSPRTLARHFAATHGMSPHQYLERLRVERACQLLQTTDIPAEEVGRSSGLPSLSTFRRLFLRHTGHLPGDYRRRYRLRIERPRWGSEDPSPQTACALVTSAR